MQNVFQSATRFSAPVTIRVNSDAIGRRFDGIGAISGALFNFHRAV